MKIKAKKNLKNLLLLLRTLLRKLKLQFLAVRLLITSSTRSVRHKTPLISAIFYFFINIFCIFDRNTHIGREKACQAQQEESQQTTLRFLAIITKKIYSSICQFVNNNNKQSLNSFTDLYLYV